MNLRGPAEPMAWAKVACSDPGPITHHVDPTDPHTARFRYVLQTYGRPDIVFTHGDGVRMYDLFGKEYLDFAAGIAVNALGHSDPRWVATLTEQAATLAHVSNLFHTAPQVGGNWGCGTGPVAAGGSTSPPQPPTTPTHSHAYTPAGPPRQGPRRVKLRRSRLLRKQVPPLPTHRHSTCTLLADQPALSLLAHYLHVQRHRGKRGCHQVCAQVRQGPCGR